MKQGSPLEVVTTLASGRHVFQKNIYIFLKTNNCRFSASGHPSSNCYEGFSTCVVMLYGFCRMLSIFQQFLYYLPQRRSKPSISFLPLIQRWQRMAFNYTGINSLINSKHLKVNFEDFIWLIKCSIVLVLKFGVFCCSLFAMDNLITFSLI